MGRLIREQEWTSTALRVVITLTRLNNYPKVATGANDLRARMSIGFEYEIWKQKEMWYKTMFSIIQFCEELLQK